jgi:hypothetical protein
MGSGPVSKEVREKEKEKKKRSTWWVVAKRSGAQRFACEAFAKPTIFLNGLQETLLWFMSSSSGRMKDGTKGKQLPFCWQRQL